MSKDTETIKAFESSARNHLLDFTILTKKDYEANWHHRETAEKLEAVERGDIKRLMVFQPPRHGKEIAHSTPVLTRDGWKIHGELNVGDYVFSPNGKPIKVIGLSEKDGIDEYIVNIDGEEIRCHANHEWNVYDRNKQRYRIIETKELCSLKLNNGSIGKRGGRNLFSIKNIKPLQFEEKELPIDTYFLGAWLGDGTRTNTSITASPNDLEPINEIKKRGFKITSKVIHKDTGIVKYGFGHQDIIQTLKRIGVSPNKHIPEIYLMSSVKQRLDLLAGIIDTDGSVEEKTGRTRIVTCDLKLAETLKELLIGLGQRPYICEQEPTLSTSGIQGKKVVYSIGFQPTIDIPTKIPRKNIKRFIKQRRRPIISAIKQGKENGRCIQVDSKDGLYLVGKSLIPTHNSELTSIRFPAWYLGRNPHNEIIVTSYSGELAERFGSQTRDIISSNEYKRIFPFTKPDPKSQSKSFWELNSLNEEGDIVTGLKKGSYSSSGIGGAITGKGANLLLIDDPFKNPISIDTPILTNNGFKKLEYLTINDKVFSHDGKLCNVTRISENYKSKRYRIIFSDNSFIDAHPDHLWTVFNRSSHSVFTNNNKAYKKDWWRWESKRGGNAKVETKTTIELFNKLKTKRGLTNWIIPNALPLKYAKKDFLIDPYVLGYWLGDGNKNTATFTCSDEDKEELMINIKRAGYYITSCSRRPTANYINMSLYRGGTMPSHTVDSIPKRLRKLKIWDNKYIPEEYFKGNYQQRLDLLRGLMDSDGTNSDGACFVNTNQDIINGIYRLIVSLGASATIKERNYNGCHYWTVNTASSFNPFKLKRKALQWDIENKGKTIRRLNRTIKDIKVIDDNMVSKCITVDSESHLFLAGNQLMPTHNSEEAQSEVMRNKVWEYYTTTLYTRLEKDAAVILILTRWHYDDLAGRLLEQMKKGGDFAEQWEIVEYPAIAEVNEKYRNKGEALWSVKYDLDSLMKTKNTIGIMNWSCTPEETPILMSNWKYKNIKDIKKGDYVVGFKNGSKDNKTIKRSKLVKSKVINVFSKIDDIYNLKMSSGRVVKCTLNHKWYTGRIEGSEKIGNYKGRKAYDIPKIGRNLMYHYSEEEIKIDKKQLKYWYYLAGIIDGEGNIGDNTLVIAQTENKNKDVLNNILSVLKKLNIDYNYYTKYHINNNWDNCGVIQVRDCRNIYMKLLANTNIAKRSQIIDRMYRRSHMPVRERDKILDITFERRDNVYALETETGNYIAWGYISSNSLYQQNPMINELQEFKPAYFTYFEDKEIKDKPLQIDIFIDPALGEKEKKNNCEVGFLVRAMEKDKPYWYILDDLSGMITPDVVVDLIFYTYTELKKHYWNSNITFYIEFEALQKSLEYWLKEEMNKRKIYLDIREAKNKDSNKDLRIRGLIPLYKMGVIKHRPWMKDKDLETQLVQFPQGRLKDRADALSFGLSITEETDTESEEETAEVFDPYKII
jgi:intein/homing endonuclease